LYESGICEVFHPAGEPSHPSCRIKSKTYCQVCIYFNFSNCSGIYFYLFISLYCDM